MGVFVCGTGFAQNPQEKADKPAAQQAVTPTEVKTEAAVGQAGDATKAGAAAAPAQQAEQALPAIVSEVGGSVEWAAPGVSVLAKDGWTAVKAGDRLEPGVQLRTGLRSHVNLQFGQTTFISVRSATHANIEQFYRSATAEHVRMGLGYGTVRGGSTEGEIRSDVMIDSTVATLAKRGTEGWQMEVEPVTGRFNISLAEYGLVEAIQKLGNDQRFSKLVRPGEYANENNIANLWVKQDIFNRTVTFFEAENVTVSDAEFDAQNNMRGYAVVAPGGGTATSALTGRTNAALAMQQMGGGQELPPTVILEPGAVGRPEGNFGTGGTFRVRVADPNRNRSKR